MIRMQLGKSDDRTTGLPSRNCCCSSAFSVCMHAEPSTTFHSELRWGLTSWNSLQAYFVSVRLPQSCCCCCCWGGVGWSGMPVCVRRRAERLRRCIKNGSSWERQFHRLLHQCLLVQFLYIFVLYTLQSLSLLCQPWRTLLQKTVSLLFCIARRHSTPPHGQRQTVSKVK